MKNEITGGMSEIEIRTFLLERGIMAMQKIAGHIPAISDKEDEKGRIQHTRLDWYDRYIFPRALPVSVISSRRWGFVIKKVRRNCHQRTFYFNRPRELKYRMRITCVFYGKSNSTYWWVTPHSITMER